MVETKNSRLKNSVYNAAMAIFNTVLMSFLGIASRAVFVRILGDELIGVNSLFSDFLALISFTELGFGTAITVSLYKPISQDNFDEIKALLNLYRKIYSGIMGIIILLSFCFIPFLKYIKTDIPFADLRIYYFIFVFNNIIGYFGAYREAYISARQQARKIIAFDTFFQVSTTLLQLAAVITTKNFLLYLLVNSALIVGRKIAVNIYIASRYPETRLKNVSSVSNRQQKDIVRKVKALAVHKIANLSISQTDSIIVSYVIGLAQWGITSNYLMLKNTISGFTMQVYSAILPGMGDLVASEDKDVQLRTFRLYDFINNWLYSFCFVALAVLSTPFVSLLYGQERVMPRTTVFVLFFNFYLAGLRDPVSVLREASGAFENDKLFTVLSAIVNLVTSLVFVQILGITGVFLGTICSTLVVLMARPVVLFGSVYNMSSMWYFKIMALQVLSAMAGYAVTSFAVNSILRVLGLGFASFFVCTAVTALLPNVLWLILYRKNENLKMAFGILKNFLKRGTDNGQA